jgi:hypothetical protein
MTEQIEDELRAMFRTSADRAPQAHQLAEQAVGRVRRARRVRLFGAGGSVLTIAAVIALSGGLFDSQGTHRKLVSPPAVARHGALPETGAASCAQGYSLITLAQRAFAFDGTVTAIGPAQTNRAGAAEPLVSATFAVHDWFRGGTGSTATVDISPPLTGEDPQPSYGVGTRLLVTGEPRWGGAPLMNAIAFSCGFTRYYDEETSQQWQSTFAPSP